MLKDTRIGLPMIGSKFWYAGVTVIDSIINAIEQMPKDGHPQLFLVMTDKDLEYLSKYELMPLHEHLIPLTDGIIFLGENIASAHNLIQYPFVHCASTDELFKNIDLLLPIKPISSPGPNLSKEAEAQTSYEAKINEFIYQLSELVEDAERIFRSSAPLPTVVHAPHRSDQITIVTSLAVAKDLTIQKSAINSWIYCGFKVVSMNAQDEMNLLKPHFPNIEFISAKRDARGQYGKPYVYIDDILSYFATQNCKICGIVNSDIHFFKENLSSFMYEQAQNSLVFGSRFDIQSIDKISNGTFYTGFDYFFFDQDFIKNYPPTEFCIGLPWWDYWLPLIAILANLPVKKVTNPICYHIIHPTNYPHSIWRELASVVLKHFSLPPNSDDSYLGNLSRYIFDEIENSSTNIEFK